MERQEEGTGSDCQVPHARNKECALQLHRYSTERSNLGSTLQKEACGVQIGTFEMTFQGLFQYLICCFEHCFLTCSFIFYYSNLDHSLSPTLILLNLLSMLWKWRRFTTHAHLWYKMEFKRNAHRSSHFVVRWTAVLDFTKALYVTQQNTVQQKREFWMTICGTMVRPIFPQFQRTRVRALQLPRTISPSSSKI